MFTKLQPPICKQISGTKPGKTITVIVGVHGNEKGPQFEWDWLNSLTILRGTLHLVFANPTASELNQRFVNVNLNRRFGKGLSEYPEDTIAREIETILDRSDALLDLHMYNESMDRPFAICSQTSNHIAACLPAKFIVNFPDSADGGGSDDYMAAHGKIGVCFETGSVDRARDYSATIRAGVTSFLTTFGLMDGKILQNTNAKVLVKNFTKIVEAADIAFTKDYSSFDEVRQGEVICTENDKPYTADEDGFILFPRPKNPIGTEAYYTLVEKS